MAVKANDRTWGWPWVPVQLQRPGLLVCTHAAVGTTCKRVHGYGGKPQRPGQAADVDSMASVAELAGAALAGGVGRGSDSWSLQMQEPLGLSVMKSAGSLLQLSWPLVSTVAKATGISCRAAQWVLQQGPW